MLIHILIAVIILQEIIHYIERRDMLNRIMCKDITEYRQESSSPPKKTIPSAHSQVIKRWMKRGDDE
jgi:hypothetical protein